jgi:hypothetical protein
MPVLNRVRCTFTAPGLLALCGFCSVSAQTKPAAVLVPFVGCPADGQGGPVKAPTGKSKALAIAPAIAQQLAYYQGYGGLGVLAPRGWHCFSQYGSDASILFVSSQPIGSAQLFSSIWQGFSAPAIELSVNSGSTSGRFQVAQIIARVFPAHMSFAKSVIAEGIEPASDFPVGPFKSDTLNYLSKEAVEYQTPPNMAGLGTQSRLLKGADPIAGVAILTGPDTDLVQLSAHLPPALAGLEPTIAHQVEADVKSSAIQ